MALSNSTTRILRTTYYDDYYEQGTLDSTVFRGQEFDFQRMLFRPRFAVQSRELTQLQTILQAQIERLGTANFKHGQPIFGAEMAINNGVVSGKVTADANVAAFYDRYLDKGTMVTSSANVTASVRQYAAIDEGYSDNYLVLKYEGANTYSSSDTVSIVGETTNASFSSDTSGVFQDASVFTVTEGVFFISGFLVRFRQQTITLALDTNRPDAVVGILVNEEVLDELDDIVGDTLLDPANQNAPGAHRFRLRLVLASYGLDAETPANFIQLCKVIKGVIQYTKNVSERFVKWSEFLETLARRTYDESGNYMIAPFAPVITKDPDYEDHFRLSVGPGKAYVHGWEVAKQEPTNLSLRKGRVTANVTNKSLALQVGNYVRAVRIAATVPSDFWANSSVVDLHNVPVANISTANDVTYTWSKIGTAKTRMVEVSDVPLLPELFANNSVYKLFFYDAQMESLSGNCTSGMVKANGAVVATVELGPGFPGTDNEIVGATMVLGGTATPVRGTFTINAYTICNATHANVEFREPLPSVPSTGTTYKLLYQLRDIDSFALYDNTVTMSDVYSNNFAFQADVDPVNGKIGAFPNRFTVVEGTSKNTLLYEVGNKFVVANTLTTSSSTFESWVPTTENASMDPDTGTTNASVTLSVVGAEYSLPTGTWDAETAQRYLVIYDETNSDMDGEGRIIQFSDVTPTNTVPYISDVTVVQNGTQYDITFTYHHSTTMSGLRTFIGFARCVVIGMPVRTHTLVLGDANAAYTTGSNDSYGGVHSGQIEYYEPNNTPGFSYSLLVPNVFRISKVLFKSTNTDFANSDISSATDVTDYFTFDSGMRDNTYEYGRAIVKQGASFLIKPDGRLLFVFDWFQPSGQGFSTVDSYLNTVNANNGLIYDEIPDYVSPVTGASCSLRDTLDFRPERTHQLILAKSNTVFSANVGDTNDGNLYGEDTYLTSADKPYLIPTSDDVWIGGYQYYLGRIDVVNLCYDGSFTINEGMDSLKPTAPKDDTGDLPLFKLTIPPYTLVDANGTPTSVLLSAYTYKRFTMNDISKVEDRVAHLEYYTALNSLETITRDQNEEDGEGNERFKNGLLVDDFHSAGVAAIDDANFTASIDQTNRELKTGFRSFSVTFSPDFAHSTTANVTIVGDMATIAYTVAPFITQNLATTAISVNPFNIASFYGNMKLLPAVDTWKNTTSMPAQVVDGGGPTEAWVSANMPSYTVWGEWETTWSGTQTSTSREYETPPGWTPESHGFRSMKETTIQDTTTSTAYQRQGTTFEYGVTSQQTSLGNKVIDTSIVHNVRARDIVWEGTGIKPGCNVHFFFDGTNVDNYIQKATVIQLQSVTQPAVRPFYAGQTVYLQKAISGTHTTSAGTANVVGTNSKYAFELIAGQLLHVVLVNQSFDAYVDEVYSNTTFALTIPDTTGAPVSLGGANIYTRTPVTIAAVSERLDGTSVVYTLSLVRAKRDANIDQAFPYIPVAGALGVDQLVNDTGYGGAGFTAGATLVVPPNALTGQAALTVWTVANSVVGHGVVRGWDSATQALRLDNDAPILPIDTEIRIVGGPGAGQATTAANASGSTNQTVLVGALSNVVAGESIYSIGPGKASDFSSNTEVAPHAGTVAGVFHMQEAQFPVGSRLARICDSANNSPADTHSSAEAHYDASGITVTQQEQILSTRILEQRQIGTTDTRSTSTTSREITGIEYVDPLAETFLVDAKIYPQGLFVASVDLCFAQVPDTDVPVTVQLRKTVNGYPSNHELLPAVCAEGCATVTLRRDRVNVTAAPDFDNSSSYTTFTFPAPVYIGPGMECAIVVMSDSDDYMVWIADMGALIVGSEDRKVVKQPYAGSFFKSQNASTWTEAPFSDLMFRLNKCVWTGTSDTPQQGKLVTRGVPPSVNTTFDSFEYFPHDCQFADVTWTNYILDLLPVNLTTDDATGSIALRHDGFPNIWQPAQERAFLQGYSSSTGSRWIPNWSTNVLGTANTIDGQMIFSTWSTDVAPYVDFQKSSVVCISQRVTQMGIEQDALSLTNPGSGYLVQAQGNTSYSILFSSAGNAEVTGIGTSFLTTLRVGDTVIIGGNLECVVAAVNDDVTFQATAVITETRSSNVWFTYGTANSDNIIALEFVSTSGADALGYVTIGPNGKVNAITVASSGAGYIGDVTVVMPAPDATSGFDTSLQTSAVITFSGETGNHPTAEATRYITRSVTLADGFEARDIKVYFDAFRPATADFYVYYRVLPMDAGESARFEDQPWRLMDMVTDNNTISLTWDDYKEFQFKTPDDRALNADSDTTDRFKAYAVKLVFSSSITTLTPRVMNFRAIAFDA